MEVFDEKFKIAAFYRFCSIAEDKLEPLKDDLKAKMISHNIVGTIILSKEGINSTICGSADDLDKFVGYLSSALGVSIDPKYSFASERPFRKVDVKVKPEIVTLKKNVELSLGVGTHIPPSKWNELITDPEVVVLDTRNDYEFKTGTFENAINPATEKFSELPDFVAQNLDPEKHKKVAMFCTGGIRCEKFAPYMRSIGFEHVFQLEGGILKYLEEIPVEEQLWKGECYVFDTRVTVDNKLEPGRSEDLSQPD